MGRCLLKRMERNSVKQLRILLRLRVVKNRLELLRCSYSHRRLIKENEILTTLLRQPKTHFRRLAVTTMTARLQDFTSSAGLLSKVEKSLCR
ncbi:hypothetical protein [Caudoviricetes sp.]|nr:hypothetical protein [Caudoviricetes sp.]